MLFLLRQKLADSHRIKTELSEKNNELLEIIAKTKSQTASAYVRQGMVAEKMAPFLDGFSWDPQKVHFLGMPIDYIYFGDDEIAIIEVKSGNARLSEKQKQIKKLVEEKKISFHLYRI
jgi:predicted Holliday junction resolvase-like endonuclease